MKLFFNPASPYVRKVCVTAHELGLSGRIEHTSIILTPISPHDGVRASNPIGKIPTLVLDDGSSLYDSPVICEYLDALEHENLEGAFDIGAISIACALGYLDFRYASEGWRTSRPRLAAWATTIGKRPSLAATTPAAP